jgi:SAM-dependent methyltransferase
MPRLLFGQRYWGECPSEAMAEILRRMDSQPWRQALEETPSAERVLAHLTSSIGPEFVHAMPWNEIETALDIGSGMGFMTSVLAQRAKTVVGLEAVPERALFQRKRAAQDGFANWRPLIASAAALPFAPATFDLVSLNGVFEYIGLWGEGDPLALQRRFLTEALRVLKPGGYLYVGIECRYGLGAVMGGPDHSGLAFTSVMPRWLAAAYCRWRRVDFYGSEHVADGYRTYTHTPTQYGRLFSEAGFGSVEVHGVFDGYNRQKAVYRLDDARARRVTRELVDPPASWKGWLVRALANSAPLGPLLESEVVVFGRKTAKEGRLTWTDLPHAGPVTQFSSHDKVFVLCFDGETPTKVFKVPKTREAAGLAAKEYGFLRAASTRSGAASASWPLRWPTPLGERTVNGVRAFEYEFAAGTPLSSQLFPVSFDPARFARLFAALVDGYEALCVKLTPAAADADYDELSGRLRGIGVDDAAFTARVAAACDKLRARRWPLRATHGDLSLSNTMLLPDGGLVLVDWENASSAGLVAIDLLRLLADVRDESRWLSPPVRDAVLDGARATVRGSLERSGFSEADYADLEALYAAHQFHMWLTRDSSARTSVRARDLLRRYHSRDLSPAGPRAA